MRLRTASIMLAAALATALSFSAAEAGMNNINVSTNIGPRAIPSLPDVKPRPQIIDARIHLNCYHTRERNELGVWVHRTHCY
jgi:hypothetical protein